MGTPKIIGSDNSVDIIVSNKYISAKHAQLIVDNGTVYIEDLGSIHGTFINGQRITKKTLLTKKDRLKLGTLLFHWQDYASDDQEDQSSSPLFVKDLFSPFGILDWQIYKYILLLALGAVIIIPFGVPTTLTIMEYGLSMEPASIAQYTNLLTWVISIIAVYIFLNLTQKMIRGLIKNNKN